MARRSFWDVLIRDRWSFWQGHHGRLVEWDAVLANVGRGLSSIPLEHRSYIQKWRQHWKRTLNIAS